MEDEIQKLKEKNFELKENIYELEEITGLEVGLPPRIPIGESSSKEDVKQKKDFFDWCFEDVVPYVLIGGMSISGLILIVLFFIMPLRFLLTFLLGV